MAESRITLNELSWHRFDFPVDAIRFRNTFTVFRRRDFRRTDPLPQAPVAVTTRGSVVLDRKRAKIDLVTEAEPSINGAYIGATIHLAARGQKKPFASFTSRLRTSRRSTRDASIDKSPPIPPGVTKKDVVITVAHYPAPWRNQDDERPHPPGMIYPITGKKHIIIVPGLGGDSDNLDDVKDILEKEKDITAQVWDWTDLWQKPRGLQNQVDINEQIREIGRRLAKRLNEWRKQAIASKVYVLSLSAGTNVIAVACDHIRNPTEHKKFFRSILFLSGALSVRQSLANVAECSERIYNYYSDADKMLTVAYPRVFLVIKLDVRMSWPAIGRFGYWEDLDNYQYITSQLAWLDEDRDGLAESYGNNGRHLRPGCLAPEYFRELLLPLFAQETAPSRSSTRPDGWRRKLHPSYRQDKSKAVARNSDVPL